MRTHSIRFGGRPTVAILAFTVFVVLAMATPWAAWATTYTQEIDVATAQSNAITIIAPGNYRLYGWNDKVSVWIATAEPVTLTLDNVTMGSDTWGQYAIGCGANTTIHLKGTNVLKGGGKVVFDDHVPCIAVENGAHLTIDAAPDNTVNTGAILKVINGHDSGPAIGGYECGDITINGGMIYAQGGPGGPGIGGYDPGMNGTKVGALGSVTINGGDVTAYGGTHVNGSGITANPDASGAGIGGSCGKPAGVITINGGSVKAYGGVGRPEDTDGDSAANGAAGIGSGNRADGFGDTGASWGLTINGGTVSAAGGNGAAGIGAGDQGNGGAPILISGGTVDAQGGQYGAGIGGGTEISLTGSGGEGSPLRVTGGTVNARGGENAAGIGGGKGGQARESLFVAGTVTASGGDKAAGIGGGYAGDTTKNGEVIWFAGGTVTAIGSNGAAGVGGGRSGTLGAGGQGGPVQVSGGSVKAIGGGSGAQAIGHGKSATKAGTLTNGAGDTVVLTQKAGMFSATSPTLVEFSQHVVTSKTKYDYYYSGSGHGGGDTNVYVYLPTGVTFNPVVALLTPLATGLQGDAPTTLPVTGASGRPTSPVSPHLRRWLVTKVKVAHDAYRRGRISQAAATLKEIRRKVIAESGRGMPAERAKHWVRTIDLILYHLAHK